MVGLGDKGKNTKSIAEIMKRFESINKRKVAQVCLHNLLTASSLPMTVPRLTSAYFATAKSSRCNQLETRCSEGGSYVPLLLETIPSRAFETRFKCSTSSCVDSIWVYWPAPKRLPPRLYRN